MNCLHYTQESLVLSRSPVFLHDTAHASSVTGMSVVWCNGKWLAADEFSLSAHDRGATLGLALFETMLAIDGLPKFVDAHWERLSQSCSRLGWECPTVDVDLEQIGIELLRRNGLEKGRGRLRLTMTSGSGSIFQTAAGADARTWITATRADTPPESVAVMISPWRRNSSSPLMGLKTASYAENILALDHARNLGYDETLFLNSSGVLCEAATSNIFIVSGGKLLTPSLDSGCLPGVARSVIMRLASKTGIGCEEAVLENSVLEGASEMFLTSAIRGPVPVSRIGQKEFPSSPVAEIMRQAWMDEICHR